jgi:rhodanese-related sulfurtransferase
VSDDDRSPSVDVLEADRRLREGGPDGPLLIDVREVPEFGLVRAERARLLPLSQFLTRYQDLPKDRELLIICASGSRSGQAAAYLLAHGWSDVANVDGGTQAWQRAGLPVRRGALAAGEGDLGF